MINILLADNQALTREGLKAILADMVDINILGMATQMAELDQLLTLLIPTVLIIDIFFNQRFTLQDINNIRKRFASLHILVLSNRQEKKVIQEVFDLGIKNFVFKDCNREELISAIYTTANGEAFYCKNTFKILFGNKLLPEIEEEQPRLSAREMELVQLVAEGLTNNEIAERLFLSVHTVKSHRKNIIKKLGFTFKNTAEFAMLLNKK